MANVDFVLGVVHDFELHQIGEHFLAKVAQAIALDRTEARVVPRIHQLNAELEYDLKVELVKANVVQNEQEHLLV